MPKKILIALLLISACEHAETTPTGGSVSSAPSEPAQPPRIDAAPHELVPSDWLVVRAGKGAPTQVLSREEYKSRKQHGERLKASGSLERKPPDLLTAPSPVRLKLGQVKTFMFEDVKIAHITIAGGTAEAFLTKPYLIHRREEDGSISEHQGADVHLMGQVTGASHLDIKFSDGSERRIEIEVAPGQPLAANGSSSKG